MPPISQHSARQQHPPREPGDVAAPDTPEPPPQPHHRILAGAAAGVGLAAAPQAAKAEWQPKKPVEFIIMAGEGGGADQIARLRGVLLDFTSGDLRRTLTGLDFANADGFIQELLQQLRRGQ